MSSKHAQLNEIEVGITEYTNSAAQGFSAIIKARFSDFHVNEIDSDGRTAVLDDLAVPRFDADNSLTLSQSEKSRFDGILADKVEAIEKLVNFHEVAENTPKNSVINIDVSTFTKEERTRFHHYLKERFGRNCISNTVDGGPADSKRKLIQIKRHIKNDRSEKRSYWPKNRGEYVHFLLYKEAMDTLSAVFMLSDCVGVKAAKFQYAGVKDKRAKTTQWLSVYKVPPAKLVYCTRRVHNLKIGNFKLSKTALKLGQLCGNHFRIALRNVLGTDAEVGLAVDSLSTNGFINYYGLQRFGHDRNVPTFLIGQYLLQNNWKNACEAILKPSSTDDLECDLARAKRTYFETKDPTKALQQFKNKRNTCIEYKLLSGMENKHPNDYVTALNLIPQNIRLLYVHSIQSLIWNRMVSKRISQFGLRPVVGDLVLCDDNDSEMAQKLKSETNDDDDMIETQQTVTVKSLSTDDLEKYTIFDVVLPLPGHQIIYPDHMKRYYEEILHSFDLTVDMFRHKIPTYSLTGNYRRILATVGNLTWKLVSYSDPHGALIRSDWEALHQSGSSTDALQQGGGDGVYKALILEFSLKSSAYATMALRELLKCDTSTTVHTQLNDYHHQKSSPDSILNDATKMQAIKRAIHGVKDDDETPIKKST